MPPMEEADQSGKAASTPQSVTLEGEQASGTARGSSPHRRSGRWRALSTLEDVRRHVARACRQLELGRIEPDRGRIEPDRARALIYALRTLADLMQDSDAEERIAELEEELAQLRDADGRTPRLPAEVVSSMLESRRRR